MSPRTPEATARPSPTTRRAALRPTRWTGSGSTRASSAPSSATPTAPPREPRRGSGRRGRLGRRPRCSATVARAGRVRRPRRPPPVAASRHRSSPVPATWSTTRSPSSVGAAVGASVVDGPGRAPDGTATGRLGRRARSDRVVTSRRTSSAAPPTSSSSPTSGRVLDAKIVGTDPETDLALLAVHGGDLPLAQLGSADAPRSARRSSRWAPRAATTAVGINVVSDRDVMVDAGTGVDVAGLVETGIRVTPDDVRRRARRSRRQPWSASSPAPRAAAPTVSRSRSTVRDVARPARRQRQGRTTGGSASVCDKDAAEPAAGWRAGADRAGRAARRRSAGLARRRRDRPGSATTASPTAPTSSPRSRACARRTRWSCSTCGTAAPAPPRSTLEAPAIRSLFTVRAGDGLTVSRPIARRRRGRATMNP